MDHDDRQIRQHFQGMVAIGYAIQTIPGKILESECFSSEGAVQGQGSSRKRGTAQRHIMQYPFFGIIQTGLVPQEHLRVSHQVMGKSDRLCTLQMGVTWHDRFQMLFGFFTQCEGNVGSEA